jgi:hypothetical protein
MTMMGRLVNALPADSKHVLRATEIQIAAQPRDWLEGPNSFEFPIYLQASSCGSGMLVHFRAIKLIGDSEAVGVLKRLRTQTSQALPSRIDQARIETGAGDSDFSSSVFPLFQADFAKQFVASRYSSAARAVRGLENRKPWPRSQCSACKNVTCAGSSSPSATT